MDESGVCVSSYLQIELLTKDVLCLQDELGSQSENEYDYEDEGFLVPHGYLSEEEGGEGKSADAESQALTYNSN